MRAITLLLAAGLLAGCVAQAAPAPAPLRLTPGPDGLASPAPGGGLSASLRVPSGATMRVTGWATLTNLADRDVPARLVLEDATGPVGLALDVRDAAGRDLGEVGAQPLELLVPAHAQLRLDLRAAAAEGSVAETGGAALRLDSAG